MKKALKIIAWTIGSVVLLVVLLVASVPLWLGTIARPAINAAVPTFTKTDFNIGHLHLNPYTGRFELGGLVVGNPNGYDEKVAASVSNLVIDVAMGTLGDKYIHVEEVTLGGLFVSYVDGGEGAEKVNNFLQIQYNLAGGKEQYEAAKAKAEAKKLETEAQLKADEEAEKERIAKMSPEERAAYEEQKELEEAAARKLVIDKLTIKGISVKYGKLPTISIPMGITLKDLGKESEGVTIGEVVDQSWQAIMKAALSVGDVGKALGGLLGDGAGALGDAVKSLKVGENAGKAVESVSEGARKTAENVKKLFNFK